MTEIQGDITDIQGDVTDLGDTVTNIQNGTTQITGAVYYDQGEGVYNYGSLTLKGDGGTQLHNVKAGTANCSALSAVQKARYFFGF